MKKDAASATVTALECAPGAYNIVDDHPSQQRVWLSAFASACGAPEPLQITDQEALATLLAPTTAITRRACAAPPTRRPGLQGSIFIAVTGAIVTNRSLFHQAHLQENMLPGNPAFVSAVNRLTDYFGGSGRGPGARLMANAMLSRQRFQLPLPQEREGLRQDEQQITLHEAYRYSIPNCLQDANSRGVRDGLLLALLLLFRLLLGVVPVGLRLG